MVVAAHPDLAPLTNLLQFIQGDIKPFPGQLRDVILTLRMRGVPHPCHMPKPPELFPFDVEE